MSEKRLFQRHKTVRRSSDKVVATPLGGASLRSTRTARTRPRRTSAREEAREPLPPPARVSPSTARRKDSARRGGAISRSNRLLGDRAARKRANERRGEDVGDRHDARRDGLPRRAPDGRRAPDADADADERALEEIVERHRGRERGASSRRSETAIDRPARVDDDDAALFFPRASFVESAARPARPLVADDFSRSRSPPRNSDVAALTRRARAERRRRRKAATRPEAAGASSPPIDRRRSTRPSAARGFFRSTIRRFFSDETHSSKPSNSCPSPPPYHHEAKPSLLRPSLVSLIIRPISVYYPILWFGHRYLRTFLACHMP